MEVDSTQVIRRYGIMHELYHQTSFLRDRRFSYSTEGEYEVIDVIDYREIPDEITTENFLLEYIIPEGA